MKRDLETILELWQKDSRRRPLLLRGARQVGKTFTVMQFGKSHFDNVAEINFEQNPRFKECFAAFDPRSVIENLSAIARTDIIPGRTLLFFDEIQECPAAITAMRYFFEQLPELHVIGAGSLLELALHSEHFKMPVGRIQFLFMQPMSFFEYLEAAGESRSRILLEDCQWDSPVSPVIHEHLLEQVKKYSFLGGMPAVLNEYFHSRNLENCARIQSSILQNYRSDFGKYASRIKHKYLEKVFYSVPKMVGQKFKYSQIDAQEQTRNLKEALELLEQVGVLLRIRRTSGEGLPLQANASDRHFKVMFVDVGLMQRLCGLTAEAILEKDFHSIQSGAVAEQFVAQEFLAYRDPFEEPALHYWAREARNSNAEVDYLLPVGHLPYPVEVKAGKTGKLKSMHMYLEKYPAPLGVQISQKPLNRELPILSIPFYLIKRVHSLITSLSKNNTQVANS